MVEKTKRGQGWAFWCCLMLLAAPLLYVVSFGPAIWIAARVSDHDGRQGMHDSLFATIYRPLNNIVYRQDSQRGRVLRWYAEIGIPRGDIYCLHVGVIDQRDRPEKMTCLVQYNGQK